jgi:uridylate kinase
MRHSFGKTVVIALGGSIIYPDAIDTQFLKEFKKFVARFNKKGVRFMLVVGGGSICRVYQNAAEAVSRLENEDKDWLGIHVTRTNAHLVRTVFRDVAHPVVIDARHKLKKLTYPVTVGGGWHPGWSTDYVATVLAHDFGAKEVIVAGKPDFVYDKDPGKYKDAKSLPDLSWKDYRKIIPAKWVPGSHAPVDPIAAKFAAEHKVKAIIIAGKDLKNFEALLNGKAFKGTVIS